jgi:hypothetical protein
MSKKVDTDGYTANAEPGAWKLVCKRGADCKDAAARRASFKLPSHCRPQKSLTRRSTRQIELTVRQLEILAYALRDVPLERIEVYRKFVFDVLRGRREIWDSDVAHALLRL